MITSIGMHACRTLTNIILGLHAVANTVPAIFTEESAQDSICSGLTASCLYFGAAFIDATDTILTLVFNLIRTTRTLISGYGGYGVSDTAAFVLDYESKLANAMDFNLECVNQEDVPMNHANALLRDRENLAPYF